MNKEWQSEPIAISKPLIKNNCDICNSKDITLKDYIISTYYNENKVVLTVCNCCAKGVGTGILKLSEVD